MRSILISAGSRQFRSRRHEADGNLLKHQQLTGSPVHLLQNRSVRTSYVVHPFVVDRTEFFNAYDAASGTVDWKRLVKCRINLASDGK